MTAMGVLVLGAGGREEALRWALKQSVSVGEVFQAPSPEWGTTVEAWLAKAKVLNIGLVVIGPDQYLADGVADLFRAAGLPVLGPSRSAAEFEWSKSFCKEKLEAYQIPTAIFCRAESVAEIKEFLHKNLLSAGWVLKADGLALGKGVLVFPTDLGMSRDRRAELTLEAAVELFKSHPTLVLEEFLVGREISYFVLCDGLETRTLTTARDYKRRFDGDQGLNTGGMGGYSPAMMTPDLEVRVEQEVVRPFMAGLRADGIDYRGVIYFGLMISKVDETPYVLEINARFGDPETQMLLPRFVLATDVASWFLACATQKLSTMPKKIPVSTKKSVIVVGVHPEYPKPSLKSIQLPRGLVDAWKNPKDILYSGFVAGSFNAAKDPHQCETTSGRIVGAVGMGDSYADAQKNAFMNLQPWQQAGLESRSDIAREAEGHS